MVVPYYTDDSRVTFSPDTLQAMDLKRVYREAMRIEFEKGCTTLEWAEGAGLRAVYDLGRQHGAAANSKPTPNDRQIRSSADTGLLPMIVSETGSDDEAETERIICSAISGGADYVNEMPRELSLERIRHGLHIGSLRISARYVQAPAEVTEPPPAPAGELKEMLADVWSEGKPLHPAARRAAIRKVAAWLEHQQEVPIGRSTASADYFAAMLRSEANR